MLRAERIRVRRWAAVVVALGLGSLLSGSSARASVLVDFNNGPSDVNNNFNTNFDGLAIPHDGGANSNFNWNATAGVSDNGGNPGGGLTTTNRDATAVYLGNNGGTTGTAWTMSSPVTVSSFFKGATLGTDRIFQIGLMNRNGSSFNNDGSNSRVSGAQQVTSANTAFINVRPYGNGEIEP